MAGRSRIVTAHCDEWNKRGMASVARSELDSESHKSLHQLSSLNNYTLSASQCLSRVSRVSRVTDVMMMCVRDPVSVSNGGPLMHPAADTLVSLSLSTEASETSQ